MKSFIITILTALITSTISTQGQGTHYPWSDIYDKYSLNDTISIHLLAVSHADPFYNVDYRAGLWALTPHVAIHYGLTINDIVDQRFDPYLSTTVAARYFTDLIHQYHHDTIAAINAFVVGPALYNNTTYHPHSTSTITPLTTYSWSSHVKRTTIDSIFHPTHYTTLTIQSPIYIATMLDSTHTSRRLFRILNPSITTSNSWIAPGSTINMPLHTDITSLYKNQQLIYDSIQTALHNENQAQALAREKAIKNANAEIIYRVRSGDTLGHIARRHHVTVRQLKSWNNLRSDMIRVGQRLKIRKQ